MNTELIDTHLGDVLGVDIKDELVVVLDLALLAADLLSGLGIDCGKRKLN